MVAIIDYNSNHSSGNPVKNQQFHRYILFVIETLRIIYEL